MLDKKDGLGAKLMHQFAFFSSTHGLHFKAVFVFIITVLSIIAYCKLLSKKPA